MADYLAKITFNIVRRIVNSKFDMKWKLIFLIFGITTLNCSAAEPPQPTTVDRYGDPLPTGAIARLGTSRLLPLNEVWAVSISPDGKTLATGSTPTAVNGAVELWQISDGKKLGELFRDGANIMSIAWSPGSDHVAISRDNRVEIWDVRNQTKTCELPNGDAVHENNVFLLRWTPNGKRLVGIKLKQLRVWDIETQKLIWSKEYFNQVQGLDVSDDGKLIAIGGEKFIELRDARDHELLHRNVIAGTVKSVAFSTDAHRFVAGVEVETRKTRLIVWDTKSGKNLNQSDEFECYKCDVDFSYDGKIALGTSDRLGLWSIGSAEPKFFQCKRSSFWFLSLSKDRTTAATADLRIQLWNLQKEKNAFNHVSHTGVNRGIYFNADGRSITAATGTEIIKWDSQTGERLHMLEWPDEICGFSLSPKNDQLAIFDESGAVTRCDADGTDRKVLFRCKRIPIKVEDGVVQWLIPCFSSDGKRLAAGTWDKHLRVWNEDDVLVANKTFETTVERIAFSADGTRIACAPSFDDAQLWDAKLENLETSFEGSFQLFVSPFAFSRDSQSIFVARRDAQEFEKFRLNPRPKTKLSSLRRIRLSDHTLIWKTDLAPGVLRLAVSPDANLVASSGVDQGFQIWSGKTGRLLKEVECDEITGAALVFSKNSRVLATASQNGSVILWDVGDLNR